MGKQKVQFTHGAAAARRHLNGRTESDRVRVRIAPWLRKRKGGGVGGRITLEVATARYVGTRRVERCGFRGAHAPLRAAGTSPPCRALHQKPETGCEVRAKIHPCCEKRSNAKTAIDSRTAFREGPKQVLDPKRGTVD
eukprot:3277446-Pleurochrysis_carterae.AAC.2